MAEPQIKYRYERKYLIPKNNLQDFIRTIFSLGFSSMYPVRRINNIYFDNYDFSSAIQNIEGLSERKKYRIRWYGSKFANSTKVIEIKIKEEFLNKKENLKIPSIRLDSMDNVNPFYNKIKNQIYKTGSYKIYNLMNRRIPTLFNSYERMYFVDIQKNIRITVDSNLEFFSPITKLSFREKFIIIEAKYDIDTTFINHFNNLSYTRYSKYVKGILQTNSFNSSY